MIRTALDIVISNFLYNQGALVNQTIVINLFLYSYNNDNTFFPPCVIQLSYGLLAYIFVFLVF